jgi:hypothetical protein
VTATGLRACYLVAADGLHSGIRRACALGPPRARRPRYGLRRHFRTAPWSDLVEVSWSPTAEAYVTRVAPDLVGVAVLGGTPGGLRVPAGRLPRAAGAAGGGRAGQRRAGRRAVAPGRAPPGGRARRARRRRLRLPGRADRRGRRGGAGPGRGTRAVPRGRPRRRLRTAWRRASRRAQMLTSGLLWARHHRVLGPRIVPPRNGCRGCSPASSTTSGRPDPARPGSAAAHCGAHLARGPERRSRSHAGSEKTTAGPTVPPTSRSQCSEVCRHRGASQAGC